MASSIPNSTYWQGFRDGAPFIVVVTPFALMFGVVATENGLSVLETVSFSLIVIAGAAQFTALQLMLDHAPTLVVVASALAVNLRMAMYSASLTPYLGAAPMWQRIGLSYLLVDQSYALSIVRFESEPDMTISRRVRYFLGNVTPVIPMWYLGTVAGALLGTAIPANVPLDFALPITFIALIAPMLRTTAHVAAAIMSVVLALAFVWVPYNLGLFIAGIGAMMTGAQVELWQGRKVAP